eukprot:m.280066 g.280066  ORF g.280066 m.280066 type:complete len:720 (-) comp19393_c0_seq2:273-2432(-)
MATNVEGEVHPSEATADTLRIPGGSDVGTQSITADCCLNPDTRLFGQWFAQVISVQRFMSDQSLARLTNQASSAYSSSHCDAFDVVVSDGHHQTKCFLVAALHSDVYSGRLQAGVIVNVTDCTSMFDETDINAPPFPVIRQLTVVSSPVPPFLRRSIKELVWAQPHEPEREFVPSVGRRRCYLDHYENCWLQDDPQWTARRDSLLLDHQESLEVARNRNVTVAELADEYRVLAKLPLLVARVTGKSSLMNFGSHDDDRPFPFQAYVQVQDQTGVLCLVLWFSSCRDYYSSIQLGDLITVSGYKVKPLTVFSRAIFPGARAELALSSRNPTGIIRIVSQAAEADADPDDLQYTARSEICQFTTRRSLREHVDGDIVNVVGTVGSVGRIEVVPDDQRGMQTVRWITFGDESSPRDFVLCLSSCSRPNDLAALQVGGLIAVTNVKVRSLARDSRSDRCLHLLTTKASQWVSWKHNESHPFGDNKEVASLLAWTETLGGECLLPGTVGGYQRWPNPAGNRPSLCELEVISFSALHDALGSLRIQERRQFYVQSFVLNVQFSPASYLVPEIEAVDRVPTTPANPMQLKRRRVQHDGQNQAANMLQVSVTSDCSLLFSDIDRSEGCVAGFWVVTLCNLNRTDAIRVALSPETFYSLGQANAEYEYKTLVSHVPKEFLPKHGNKTSVADLVGSLVGRRVVVGLDVFRTGPDQNFEIVAFALRTHSE